MLIWIICWVSSFTWAQYAPIDKSDDVEASITYRSPITEVGALYPDYVGEVVRPAARRSYGGGGGDDFFDDDEGFDDDYDPYTEEPGQLPIGNGLWFLLLCAIGYAFKYHLRLRLR